METRRSASVHGKPVWALDWSAGSTTSRRSSRRVDLAGRSVRDDVLLNFAARNACGCGQGCSPADGVEARRCGHDDSHPR